MSIVFEFISKSSCITQKGRCLLTQEGGLFCRKRVLGATQYLLITKENAQHNGVIIMRGYSEFPFRIFFHGMGFIYPRINHITLSFKSSDELLLCCGFLMRLPWNNEYHYGKYWSLKMGPWEWYIIKYSQVNKIRNILSFWI